MKSCKFSILFFWALFVSCSQLKIKVVATTSSPSEREIEAKLKLLNKPAVKTIKSEDGDVIDCVDIYKQLAFDHPALKNHKIQQIPDFLLESKNSSDLQAKSIVFQTWQKSGSCPEGTVPIRRIRKEDLLRAGSLDLFGRKPPMHFIESTNTTKSNYPVLNGSYVYVPENRTKASLVTLGYSYIGAEAKINVWRPNVDKPDDFTTAQIWLKTGNGPQYFESIEAGWQVNPKLYGDGSARYFTHWTSDSYTSTGCFDVACPGFMQLGQVVLGGAIKPTSFPYGTQKEINVGMFWDNSGNWWLNVDNHIVGYWPAELLTGLTYSAKSVEWGGQVYSPMVKKNTPHTATAMGSGETADGRWGSACYMRNLRIKDYSRTLKYPEFVSTNSEEPYCYSIVNDAKYGKDPILYFGGPGRRPPYCP